MNIFLSYCHEKENVSKHEAFSNDNDQPVHLHSLSLPKLLAVQLA